MNISRDALSYIMTINNPGLDDYYLFSAENDIIRQMIKYAVIGKEGFASASTSQAYLEGSYPITQHLQCLVVFNEPKTWRAVKKLFPRAHIEICRSDLQSVISYCKKENNFLEIGSEDYILSLSKFN